jgi:hypothetical protein
MSEKRASGTDADPDSVAFASLSSRDSSAGGPAGDADQARGSRRRSRSQTRSAVASAVAGVIE